MALPVITNVYRITLNQTLDAKIPIANVFHVRGASTNALTVMDRFSAIWTGSSALPGIQSTLLTYDTIDVIKLDGGSATVVDTVANRTHTNLHGTLSGAVTPANACLVQTWQTQLGGRSHRGRSYYSAVAASLLASDGTTWGTNAGLASTTTTFAAAMIAETTAWDEFVVASYKNSSAEPITHWRLNSYLGTQRGRTTIA